jgi:hypothetical protein
MKSLAYSFRYSTTIEKEKVVKTTSICAVLILYRLVYRYLLALYLELYHPREGFGHRSKPVSESSYT